MGRRRRMRAPPFGPRSDLIYRYAARAGYLKRLSRRKRKPVRPKADTATFA
jgi:hypothetical protein